MGFCCLPPMDGCQVGPTDHSNCQSRNWCIGKTVMYGVLTALAVTVTLVALYKGLDSISRAVNARGGATLPHIAWATGSIVTSMACAMGTLYCWQAAKLHWTNMPAPAPRAQAPRTQGRGHRLGNAPANTQANRNPAPRNNFPGQGRRVDNSDEVSA